jgi:hypothetical protein
MVVSRATPAHGQVDKCPLRRKTAGVARFETRACLCVVSPAFSRACARARGFRNEEKRDAEI